MAYSWSAFLLYFLRLGALGFGGPIALVEDGLPVVGVVACPMGLTEHDVFEDVDDTRGCDACTCGTPAVSCNDGLDYYSTWGCTGALTPVPDDGLCHPIPTTAIARQYFATAPTGKCASSGGMPNGGVAPKTTHTICCMN